MPTDLSCLHAAVNLIKRNPNMPFKQISDKLGMTRMTLYRHLDIWGDEYDLFIHNYGSDRVPMWMIEGYGVLKPAFFSKPCPNLERVNPKTKFNIQIFYDALLTIHSYPLIDSTQLIERLNVPSKSFKIQQGIAKQMLGFSMIEMAANSDHSDSQPLWYVELGLLNETVLNTMLLND